MQVNGLAMANDNISPEERLFKVIQETKKPASGGARSLRATKWRSNLKNWIASRLTVFGAHNANKEIVLPIKLHEVDLKKVNRALWLILAFLILLTAYYAFKRPNLSKITGAVFESSYQAKGSKPIDTFKPLAFYAEQVRKRDIFHPVTSGIKGIAGSGLQALTKDLGLAGIYQPVGNPSEAMIEDKSAKKTYFLKTGDEIKGMKVKAILKDRVILQYGEEEMELM